MRDGQALEEPVLNFSNVVWGRKKKSVGNGTHRCDMKVGVIMDQSRMHGIQWHLGIPKWGRKKNYDVGTLRSVVI